MSRSFLRVLDQIVRWDGSGAFPTVGVNLPEYVVAACVSRTCRECVCLGECEWFGWCLGSGGVGLRSLCCCARRYMELQIHGEVQFARDVATLVVHESEVSDATRPSLARFREEFGCKVWMFSGPTVLAF